MLKNIDCFFLHQIPYLSIFFFLNFWDDEKHNADRLLKLASIGKKMPLIPF